MTDDGRTRPDQRWNPGARYRGPMPARRPTSAAADVQPLVGRLRRGPARRTAVFDRDVWRPATAGVRPQVAEALSAAAERYRRGAVSTSGLVRAVGHALAS
ncbi:hypothetical protein BCE75_11031 [Isoptericola sp. CG 20/1183]|uniref:Uncharacterized protein n=1 Tax=Isoptericola halotolerans TaxID=300560 RepID=A0ABX5ECD7_9MICO|nr:MULTISPECIES: hypothetical protein [Isoptericola]PRZ04488.1 hypothetical protein BCL65_110150 [Isoptericola halotolerans]PRZ04614.1 hypothetical protein BCE75_11031 [Isoptericola sp. CG 20/1183]